MTAKHRYYDSQGNELDESDALDERGIVRDGIRMVTPITLRDSIGRRLVDAAGQALSDYPARRSGYVFTDTSAERRREAYDFAKAELSNRWKGGMEQGDQLTIAGKRLQVFGWNDEDRMVLGDTEGLDGDELREAAYQEYKTSLSDAWKKKRPSPDDDDDDEEKERKRKRKKPSDMEHELAGPLSDEHSIDSATLKREAWQSMVDDLTNAWRR